VSLFHAFVLGLVQGLTEFLPISSSGHLVLVPWLFGWNDFDDPELKKQFDVSLHIGTAIAVAIYFRTDLMRIAKAGLRTLAARRVETPDERLAWLLVLATIPGVIAGVLLDEIVADDLSSPGLIAIMLAAFSGVLYLADRCTGERTIESVSARDAVAVGVAQAVALQPGVSRSGITISTARFLGYDRPSATRLSFLMSMPIVLGACLYEAAKLFSSGGIPDDMVGAFAVGIATSAISGFIAIAALLRFVRERSFTPFVVYRLGLAALVLLLIATGVR
jgi:undecaprenyl-diphosphatase